MRDAGRSGSPTDRGLRGQAEVLGTVLLVGIVVSGTTLLVVFGAPALQGARDQSSIERAEHWMTAFDSRAATVALGDASVRSVDYRGGEGGFEVDPDEGRIVVTHVNYDGGADDDGNIEDDGPGDDDHDIYNQSLGTVRYSVGETTLAYQGGGVWQDSGNGVNSSMVSPPEFHYRGSTLTLPVVRVTGVDGGSSGRTTARITRETSGVPVFPDESQSYPSGKSYTNPSEEGRIVVTVYSEYADAWGRYFEERTEGNIVYLSEDRVSVTLISLGLVGDFEMPADGNSINVQGVSGSHRITNFDITIRPDDTDSADFANLQWSMYAESGNRQFELHLEQAGGSGCSATVDLMLYFSEDGGNTYESWVSEDAFETECGDYNSDGDDEVRLSVEFTNSTLEMENEDLTGNLVHFNAGSATRDDTPTFDQHPGESLPEAGASESYTYADGDEETMNTTFNHYLAVMGPGVQLTVDDKNSDSVSEDGSFGNIEYPGGPEYVTFLHITENRIEVEVS